MAKKTEVKKIECNECKKPLGLNNFYKNKKSILSKDGFFPMCKSCIKNQIDPADINTVYNILRLMDIKFSPKVWKDAANENPSFPLGSYLKIANSGLNGFSGTWDNSEFDSEIKMAVGVKVQCDNSFKVTDDIKDLFGYGFSNEEYTAMYKKYMKLKNNYTEYTYMHTEALLRYIRAQVKYELATASGDSKEAKQWGDLAQKEAIAAKINPSAMSKTDMQGGLSGFAELSKAVEEAVDVIEILPKFKYLPQDAPDFIIWCYINYVRDLKGLPPCEYYEVYEFYDKNKQTYIEQYGDPYGIFKNNEDIKTREDIKKFVMDYSRKLEEEDDSDG